MSGIRPTRRAILRWVGVAAVLPVLQACAPAAAPSSTTAPTPAASKPTAVASTPTSAPAKPPEATKPASAASTTTVRYSTWIGPLKDQVDAFNQTSDAIAVEFEQVPFAQIADKTQVAMAAGTSADVVQIPGSWWWGMLKRQVFAPLDDLLKTHQVDLNAFDFPPRNLAEFEGKLYGLPIHIPVVYGMIYNTRLFQQAGVDLPTEEWTWDDLTAAALKLHKPPESYALTATGLPLLVQMILSNGGTVISSDDKQCLVDSTEAIEAVQTAVDWLLTHKVSLAPGEEKVLGDVVFASDKLAIGSTVIADWGTYSTQTKNGEIEAGTVTWPISAKTKNRVLNGFTHGTAIAGKTKVFDQAGEFLVWSTTNDEALKLQIKYFPVNYKLQTYIDQVADAKQRTHMASGIPILTDTQLDYWGPKTSESQNAFQAEYDLALLGQKPVPEAMQAAAKTITDILLDG